MKILSTKIGLETVGNLHFKNKILPESSHKLITVKKILFLLCFLIFAHVSWAKQATFYIINNDTGSHVEKAYAYNSTDTVYKKLLNDSEWITQASGFPIGSTPVDYLSAVDSNIVWGSTQSSSEFTRTVNGGTTWKPGRVTNNSGLRSSMIFGLDSLKAYALLAKFWGNDPQGIYMTADGGTTWTHQASANYDDPNSLPDIVHFFNTNDGVTMGDPVNGEFEIYTTTDGGNVWTQVVGSNIPNPLSTEWAVIGYYSAIHDKIWAGTNEGRVYKSVEKNFSTERISIDISGLSAGIYLVALKSAEGIRRAKLVVY